MARSESACPLNGAESVTMDCEVEVSSSLVIEAEMYILTRAHGRGRKVTPITPHGSSENTIAEVWRDWQEGPDQESKKSTDADVDKGGENCAKH